MWRDPAATGGDFMSTTPKLGLPYLAAGQAQKHVTLNESLRMLDVIVQLAVESRALAAPPASPAEGAAYLVAAGPSGAWSGHAGKIAAFQDGGWMIYAARAGWLAWVKAESQLCAYDGATWAPISPSLQNAPMLGVNATADATNRIVTSSAATLLNHEGAGHQLKINKAAAGDTASLLLQTGFSGRAEIGTAGDDHLRIKTSIDGSTWKTALMLDAATANAGFGLANVAASARLTVESPNGGTAFFVNAGAGGAGGGAGLLTYTWFTPAGSGDRFGQILFGSLGSGAYPAGINAAGFSAHAEGAWSLGTSHPSYIRFDTTSAGQAGRAERLRITASGQVGIGTATPTTRLHVAGDIRIGAYTVATLPAAAASGAGAMVYVSNEAGGAVLAFSDGASWRRVTDRAVVS
jgi:hypothetical protein